MVDSPLIYNNTTKQYLSSPSSDLEAERERERKADFQKRLDEDWGRLLKAYPVTGAMDLTLAKRELGRLSLGDRGEAIRWASVYAAEVRAAKRSHPKEVWRWLADRDFERIAELRQARAEKGGDARPRTFVEFGTPAFAAWARAKGKPIEAMLTTRNEAGKVGWWFPTLFPPGVQSTGPPHAAE